MHPDDLRYFVNSRHQEMIQRAEQARLANQVQPAWRWAVPNLQRILGQMIARFEAHEDEPQEQPKPSKLATDSGTFRVR